MPLGTKAVEVSWKWMAWGVVLCVISRTVLADGGVQLPPGNAQSSERGIRQDDSPLNFDMPAQPLATALDQYAYLTHRPVVYPGDLATGRMASAVHGALTPEAALHQLLVGSGLSARRFRTSAGETFVLSALPDGGDASREGATALLTNPNGFPAQVQAGILSALCARSNTAPGNYGVLFRFRLDADGRVRDARLLDPSGSHDRDVAILSALEQVQVATPPKSLAGKLLTMAVLPQGGNAGANLRQCSSRAQSD